MPERILITGAAGFIGSHAVDRLLAAGHTVIGIDNFDPYYDPAIKRDNIKSALGNKEFHFIEGDLVDETLVDKLFKEKKPTHIIHLAARAGVRPSWDDPIMYEKSNVFTTLNLLKASGKFGLDHFIYGSSSSVYGINETVPFRPTQTTQLTISPYAASKLAAEGHLYAYHHLHKFKATTLRFFTVYGPRQRPEMAIHKFARLITDGNPIPMFGDGETERDYTFIDDIIKGLSACLNRDGEPYEILNIGSANIVKLKDLITTVGIALGIKPMIEIQPIAPGDVPITYADITRTTEILGYAPSTTIDQGIPLFVEWFREKKKQGII